MDGRGDGGGEAERVEGSEEEIEGEDRERGRRRGGKVGRAEG